MRPSAPQLAFTAEKEQTLADKEQRHYTYSRLLGSFRLLGCSSGCAGKKKGVPKIFEVEFVHIVKMNVLVWVPIRFCLLGAWKSRGEHWVCLQTLGDSALAFRLGSYLWT